MELVLVMIIFLPFCFFGFIAGDTLDCGLAVCYKVFTPLFAAVKCDSVFRARK
jgi:hypothetical protein